MTDHIYLIVDSHSSHLYNLPFYQVMKENNIHVFTIPRHTSHILQPLDSTPFAMFKRHWEVNLMKYNAAHHGRSLNKVDFGRFLPQVSTLLWSQKIFSQVSVEQESPPMILLQFLLNH